MRKFNDVGGKNFQLKYFHDIIPIKVLETYALLALPLMNKKRNESS